MSIVGKNDTRDLIELSRADLDGQNQNYLMFEKREKLKDFELYYEEAVESGFAVTIGELAIKGSDLIELGVEPGPKMGEILKICLDEVLKYPFSNTKEELTQLALDIINDRYRG
jgi:tRNA nucleotidyltransferase (CCA-adding enzyme)